MSQHSYSRIWIHIVWGTKNRENILPKSIAVPVSEFLKTYAAECNIYMRINYGNSDHVHVLIDMPVDLSLAKVVQKLKGASSHWINHNNLLRGKFAWGRGYGGFSVSHSNLDRVARYIANQEAHHQKKTFSDEYGEFVRHYGLRWYQE